MSYEKEAFFDVCSEAIPAKSSYVSLYRHETFYGGPEEGGWWGHDVVLVAHHECRSEVEAEAVAAQVNSLAAKLSKDARDSFNRGCAAEMAWLEARGLDADYLPEVGGSDEYRVVTESIPGEHEYRSSRHYE